ncbi:FkbM family methyltransferase [Synechococcus sp. CS-1324]|nr:FkbM family methyltransferase [Synechococcus sp. CS-1324]PZV05928.1 MAG: hypothetical protein DCF23_01320 [Cyanobium sp.]
MPETFARLQRNVRLNDLNSLVTSYCLALGAEDGTLRFTSGSDTTNRAMSLLSTFSDEPTVEVLIISVDQLLRDKPIRLMWKVDVEGYEPYVLRGATTALRNPLLKAVLLEADTSSAAHDGTGRLLPLSVRPLQSPIGPSGSHAPTQHCP